MLRLDFMSILISLPGILIALTLHEFAHGYSAYLLGDNTAKEHGRLTIDPLAHIDIIGFLMLIFAGFGWAKPVPVNPYNFKSRKWGMFIVSIAGVVTNFVLAIVFTLLFVLMSKYFYSEGLHRIISYAILINLVLGVFNLFPIPPLDGSKLLLTFLPKKFEYYYYNYQKYSFIILIVLLYTGGIRRVLNPIISWLTVNVINNIISFFY